MRFPQAFAVTVFLALGLPPAVSAQTADEIVARNLQAKGGEALLKSTTSVRTTARGTMQGQNVTVVTATKRPFMVRNEMSLDAAAAGAAPRPQGMPDKMVQGFDGQNMWMAVGSMPAQALPAGPQTEAMKRTSQIDSPLLDYQAKGTSITLGEPAVEGGKKLHHLIVTPQGAPPMHYYIDPVTNLESRLTIEVDEGGQKMRMEMRFGDFRAVEGRTVPFAITQFLNGNQVGELRFEKVEFNVPLDDAMFRMPK